VNSIAILFWTFVIAIFIVPIGLILFIKFKRQLLGYKTLAIIEAERKGGTIFIFDWAKQVSTSGAKKANAWLLYKERNTVPLADKYPILKNGKIFLNLYSPVKGIYYHKDLANVVEEVKGRGADAEIVKKVVVPVEYRDVINEVSQQLRDYYSSLFRPNLGFLARSPLVTNILFFTLIICIVLIIMATVVAPKIAALQTGINVICKFTNATLTKGVVSGV